VDRGLVCKVFLRQAQFQTALSHHFTEYDFDSLHGGQLRQLQTINLQTILLQTIIYIQFFALHQVGNALAMPKKPVPVWPILVAGAYLAFLIYCSVQHQRQREAKKREVLESLFPTLMQPTDK
jgi:hypothetical protein